MLLHPHRIDDRMSMMQRTQTLPSGSGEQSLPSFDVLGIGGVVVDDLLFVDHHPLPDTKMAIQKRERCGGGLVATGLVAAARLGASAVFAGILGDDSLSAWSVDELERAGVDCRAVIRRAGARPGHATVIVDRSTGQRCILYTHDGVTLIQPEDISADLIAACKVLFVDHSAPHALRYAVRVAQAHAIPIVADFERVMMAEVGDILPLIGHLIIGIECGRLLTGLDDPVAMVNALGSRERACCAITAGEHGCWYAEHGGEVQHVPALKVEVVDTTGCGDVFHGAYAACIARGEPVDVAIRVATVVAGVKATHLGGRNGLPDRARVDQILSAGHV